VNGASDTKNTRTAEKAGAMSAPKPPNPFALFVKVNYSKYLFGSVLKFHIKQPLKGFLMGFVWCCVYLYLCSAGTGTSVFFPPQACPSKSAIDCVLVPDSNSV
jgi:hypothetical protein